MECYLRKNIVDKCDKACHIVNSLDRDIQIRILRFGKGEPGVAFAHAASLTHIPREAVAALGWMSGLVFDAVASCQSCGGKKVKGRAHNEVGHHRVV